MARKTSMYTVADEGRDHGRVFLITEMPASRAEAWATRVLLALMGSNVQMPEGFEHLGMAALAELGMRALTGLKWEVAEPLLEEMMSCVQIIPDPSKTHVVRALIESDIEEVLTRFRLRAEVWKIHMGFLQTALPSLSTMSKDRGAERSATKTSHE